MYKLKSIFVIIDPVTEKQLGLQRAVHIARTTHASLMVYLCVYSELDTDAPEELEKVELERYQLWLDAMIAPYRKDLQISTKIEWSRDWRSAIASAVKLSDCDIVIKPTHRRSRFKQLFITTSDRYLIKSSNCPVLLVSSAGSSQTMKVLMAVDLHREDKQYSPILDTVIEYSKAVISSYKDGELHVVNSYETSDEYVHTTDISNRTGVDPSCVHVIGGKPEYAISKIAGEIDADLVIVGTSTKGSLMQRFSSYVADTLPNYLSHDILVIKPSTA